MAPITDDNPRHFWVCENAGICQFCQPPAQPWPAFVRGVQIGARANCSFASYVYGGPGNCALKVTPWAGDWPP